MEFCAEGEMCVKEETRMSTGQPKFKQTVGWGWYMAPFVKLTAAVLGTETIVSSPVFVTLMAAWLVLSQNHKKG